ncbi:MAG TPA: hypothetical protein VD794_07060 [Flavisolibacter sp.]|nr:hypothetical protein [Flavisolibacter sp.]
MANAREKAYARKVLADLKMKYATNSSKWKTVNELDDGKVFKSIQKAKAYGLTFENDVLLYVECMIYLGIDFDNNPKTGWAKKILTNETMSGETKMNTIYEHIIFKGHS